MSFLRDIKSIDYCVWIVTLGPKSVGFMESGLELPPPPNLSALEVAKPIEGGKIFEMTRSLILSSLLFLF